MALDRFIYFEDGQTPSFDEIREVCVHYVGGSGAGRIKLDPPRVFAVLPGASLSPTARPERFIEVYVDEDNVDVMTREGDEFTNAVAEGLSALICRRFCGKRDYAGSYPDNYIQQVDEMAHYRWMQAHGKDGQPFPGGALAAYDTLLFDANARIKELEEKLAKGS